MSEHCKEEREKQNFKGAISINLSKSATKFVTTCETFELVLNALLIRHIDFYSGFEIISDIMDRM